MRELFSLLTVLISLLLWTRPAFGDLRDAPLPSDAFVMAPAPDVPDSLKPFSGKWVGDIFFGSIHLPHVLVIERMEPMLVWSVWSLGLSVYAGGPGAWYRIPMRVQSNSLVASGNRGQLTYRLRSNDEIEVSGTQAGMYPTSGTLKRVSMAVEPFSAEEPATYWPTGVEQMVVGASTNPDPLPWPQALDIQSAVSNAAEGHAMWLGKWAGWACRRTCDVKLAVLEVSGNKARVLELFTGEHGERMQTATDADFIGDELVLRVDGHRTNYRMRASGDVEVLVAKTGLLAWGVLSKQR